MRIAFAAGLAASSAFAQQAPDLAVLEQNADKKAATWDALAKSLESKIVRMLPCDARVRTSIEEVSRASDARLAALTQYLQAAMTQSLADAQVVAKGVAQEQGLAREADVDRAEAEQERIAIDAQVAELAESVKRRALFNDANKALITIADLVRGRAANAQQDAARRAALIAALNELSAAFDAHAKAIQTEIRAVGTETSRWSQYYTARIARAATECSITNQAPAAQRKKR